MFLTALLCHSRFKRGVLSSSVLPLPGWLVAEQHGQTLSSELVAFEGTTFFEGSGMYEVNLRLMAEDIFGTSVQKWLQVNVIPAAPTVLAPMPSVEFYINETFGFSLPDPSMYFRANNVAPGMDYMVTQVLNDTAQDPPVFPGWLAYDNVTMVFSGKRQFIEVSASDVIPHPCRCFSAGPRHR